MSRTWLPKLWKQIIGSTTRAQIRCRKPRRTHLGVEMLENRMAPAVLTVNTCADETTPDQFLSLREAITVVNTGTTAGLSPAEMGQISGPLGSNDTIQFQHGLTGMISLTSGELDITREVTIKGSGATLLTVNGNVASRICQIDPNVTATISGLEIENGLASGQPGGGILNQGNLTLTSCQLNDNSAYNGGAVYNAGILTVNSSVFAGNQASYYGGAIYNAGTMTVEALPGYAQCSFYANVVNGDGGGGAFFNAGSATLDNITITTGADPEGYTHGNTAVYGGGIFNESSLTITDCVVSGNQATYGGGIYNEGSSNTLFMNNGSYITANHAYAGGGIYNVSNVKVSGDSAILSNNATWRGGGIYNSGTVTLDNTTVGTAVVGTNGQLNKLGNSAGDGGGGVMNGPGANLLVQNQSIFAYNGAATGAGIDNLGYVRVENSIFEFNTATWNGGGIANWASATVLNSTFEHDTAANDGGGIYTNSSSSMYVTLVGYGVDTFEYDSANNVGGGFYNGGAGVSGFLTLNLVFGTNSAAYGPNIYDLVDWKSY